MVDKLDPLGKSIIAGRIGRAIRAGRGAEPKRGDPGATPARDGAGSLGHGSFDERISRRVAAIDADDPRRRQKVFRAFIEMRLLDEFGAALGNDAGFQQLVDDVVLGMEGDTDLRTDIEALADKLLEGR